MPRRFRRSRPPGSALIVAVVLMVILTVVGLALVTRSSRQIESSGSLRHFDSAFSCAEGARQLLMSQFSIYSLTPTSITLDTTVGNQVYATGHYNTFNVKSVQENNGAGATQPVGVSDITNRTSYPHLGGNLYRMTVVCSDTSGGHQDEVEFLVRFGL